jgi:predicted DNA-binding transcriptional regulator AlpA
MTSEFISIKDLCARYSIQRTACYQWRKQVNFPSPITPPNCHPRWRSSDIKDWELSNKSNIH